MASVLNDLRLLCYEFGSFRLIPAERLLLRDGEPVALPPKVFDTLLVLAESGGRLVEKDVLLEKVWRETFVEESTLARNISILRKLLGENGDGQILIETVPKHGYRLVEPVRLLTANGKNGLHPAAVETTTPQSHAKVPRRPILWLLLLFVVAGLFASVSFWNAGPRQLSDIRSVAVLPFKSIGAGERDESLELGMAEAVITRLGTFKQIVVRPTGAVAKYLATEADTVQAGRDLKVEAVLEGSIQRKGDRVRVSARLVNAGDGSQLWAESFDTRFTDIFSVQDSISSQIANALNLRLSGETLASISGPRTESAEAYQLFLKGRYFLGKNRVDFFAKAADCFMQAIVLDANFAAAYAGLADAYSRQVSYGSLSPRDNLPKARIAAEKAIALDDKLSDAHSALGHILMLSWDWQGAEKEIKRSLELNPNSPGVYNLLATYLSSQARHDEALAAARRAIELDPVSISGQRTLERVYYFARRYDDVLAASAAALELNPSSLLANSWREMAFEQKGRRDEALETRFQAMASVGFSPNQVETWRNIYREKGWQAYWQVGIDDAKKLIAEHKYVMPYHLARNYARIGDNEQAMEWLDRCFEEHSDHLTVVKTDPLFDALHGDARFQRLLRKMNFPEDR